MAFVRSNSVPPDPTYPFSVRDFLGGLNNVEPMTNIEDNEASDIMNIMFSSDGTIEKRYGTSKARTKDYGGAITYLDEYMPINSTNKQILATLTELYIDETKLCDVDGQIDGVNYRGKFYFVDGEYLYVYDGTTYYRVTEAPQQSLTADALTDAAIIYIDEWDDRLTIGDDVVIESVGGTHTTTISALDEENLKVTMTDVLTFDVVDGDLVRFFIPQDTTYTIGEWEYDATNHLAWYQPCANELSDAYLGENLVPTGCKYIELRENRLYLAGADNNPHTVFISDVENGLYFPVVLPLALPPNSDIIRGMKLFHGAMIVGRTRDIYAIYGDTNRLDVGTTFYQKQIATSTGFMSHRSIKHIQNYLMFVGADGDLYTIHTPNTDVNMLANLKRNQKVDFKLHPILADTSDLEDAVAIVHNNEYWLSLGDKVVVYSYDHQAFAVYDSFNAESFYVMDGVLQFGNSDGYLMKYDTSRFNDDGVAISSYYASKRYDMGESIRIKQFKEAYLVAKTYSNYDSSFKVVFEIDYNDTEYEPTITSEIAVWGRVTWGERLITRNISKSLPLMIGQRGRLVKFIISNETLDEPFRLYEFNILYKKRGYR